jgi:hypothetical protein
MLFKIWKSFNAYIDLFKKKKIAKICHQKICFPMINQNTLIRNSILISKIYKAIRIFIRLSTRT